MRYIDQATLTAIREFVALPWMKLEDGKRHARLVNQHTGDFVPRAGSPSDHRAARNAKAAARRLAETGCGLIFAKTGHLPTAH